MSIRNVDIDCCVIDTSPTPTQTVTPSNTATPGFTPSKTSTPTVTPTLTNTATPTMTPPIPFWGQVGSDIDGEAAGDYSGYSVSLSSDGTVVAIGAYSNDGNGNNSGHVRVYAWNGTSWEQRGSDIDGDAAAGITGLGTSVSLDSSGDTLAIGAPSSGFWPADVGLVRIYYWNGDGWIQKGSDIIPLYNPNTSQSSGASVSLNADGNTVAIGDDLDSNYNGSVSIYDFNGADWQMRGNKISGAGGVADIDSASNTVVIGSTETAYASRGKASVYFWNGSNWTQKGVDILGENNGDRFGTSVSISADGDIIAVGALYNDGTTGNNCGSVRVYVWNGGTGTWVQRGSDIDGEDAGDYSGTRVSLSSDGSVVAIGAIGNDGVNGTDSGHVRVYVWNSGSSTWDQRGSDIDGESAGDGSGIGVSLSSDGTVVAIGAWFNDDNGIDSGHVRVYSLYGLPPIPTATPTVTPTVTPTNTETPTVTPTKTPTVTPTETPTVTPTETETPTVTPTNTETPTVTPTNTETPTVTPTNTITPTVTPVPFWGQVGSDIDGEAPFDESGYSVSLSSDGTVVAIGAYGNDANGTDSGHVRVYAWNGTSWTQRGGDIDGEAGGDQSGFSVSLSSDGSVVAIGANQNDGNGSNSGHVRVYVWNSGAGTWDRRGGDINGEAADDKSGHSVSLSSDGTVVAIGAPYNNGNGSYSGHVRVYAWNGSIWSKRGGDIDGEAAGDYSGYSVSLSSDGTVVAIGAPLNDGNGTESGHVRIYVWNSGTSTWVQRGSDIDGEAAGDRSGHSISLSSDGTVVAIGAYGNDANGTFSGHVRVYVWDSGTSTWDQLGDDIDGEAGGNQSGYSVSLSSDGTAVAIGAPFNDGNGIYSGHVRIYVWNSATSTWVQRGSDIDGEAAGDRSGWSVRLSSDGTVVVIGSPYNNGVNGTTSGHVRIYKYSTPPHTL